MADVMIPDTVTVAHFDHWNHHTIDWCGSISKKAFSITNTSTVPLIQPAPNRNSTSYQSSIVIERPKNTNAKTHQPTPIQISTPTPVPVPAPGYSNSQTWECEVNEKYVRLDPPAPRTSDIHWVALPGNKQQNVTRGVSASMPRTELLPKINNVLKAHGHYRYALSRNAIERWVFTDAVFADLAAAGVDVNKLKLVEARPIFSEDLICICRLAECCFFTNCYCCKAMKKALEKEPIDVATWCAQTLPTFVSVFADGAKICNEDAKKVQTIKRCRFQDSCRGLASGSCPYLHDRCVQRTVQ